jgi:hypothetical protein
VADASATSTVKVETAPKGLAVAAGGLVVAACVKGIVVLRNGVQVSALPIAFEALVRTFF